MEEINVQLLNMDTMIPEHLVKNADDSYTIFLNARLSQDGQLKAYQHALKHINSEDFEKTDVQNIELQAHELKSSDNTVSVPASKFEKRIEQLQRERKKLQKALKDKEKEIDIIIDLCGSDYFFKAAERKWLYEGIE